MEKHVDAKTAALQNLKRLAVAATTSYHQFVNTKAALTKHMEEEQKAKAKEEEKIKKEEKRPGTLMRELVPMPMPL